MTELQKLAGLIDAGVRACHNILRHGHGPCSGKYKKAHKRLQARLYRYRAAFRNRK